MLALAPCKADEARRLVAKYAAEGLIKPRHDLPKDPGPPHIKARPAPRPPTVWKDPYAAYRQYRLSIGMSETPTNGDRYPSLEAAERGRQLMLIACRRIYIMRRRGVPESPDWKLRHHPRIWEAPWAEYVQFRRSLGMSDIPSKGDRYPNPRAAAQARVLHHRCYTRQKKQDALEMRRLLGGVA